MLPLVPLVLSGCSDPLSFPEEHTQEAIAAYLAEEHHRQPPWIAQTDAPREATWEVSPHGRVQVWLNDVVIDSQAAGNGGFLGEAHTTGSMAVKELYDSADAQVGAAVMLKIDGVAQSWVYYCDGPADRCGSTEGDTPHYAVAYDSACYYCHGGEIFNEPPTGE